MVQHLIKIAVKAQLKAMNDDALNRLLESMMNDTDVKGEGREQIKKMPREHKEMMLLPWMAKKGGSSQSTGMIIFLVFII